MNLEKTDTNNPYQAPSSELPPPLSTQASAFYIVAKKKFFLLFISTLSMYSLYWFWKNWTLYRQSTGEKLWPIPRAIFAIFFTHSLFDKIHSAATQHSHHNLSKLNNFATVFVLASIAFNFIDKIEMMGIIYLGASILLMAILVFSMWQAQQQANIASGDPEGLENHKLSAVNYIWIVIGALLWLFIIVGIGSAPFEYY